MTALLIVPPLMMGAVIVADCHVPLVNSPPLTCGLKILG
jgi:hypothetical protein